MPAAMDLLPHLEDDEIAIHADDGARHIRAVIHRVEAADGVVIVAEAVVAASIEHDCSLLSLFRTGFSLGFLGFPGLFPGG